MRVNPHSQQIIQMSRSPLPGVVVRESSPDADKIALKIILYQNKIKEARIIGLFSLGTGMRIVYNVVVPVTAERLSINWAKENPPSKSAG